MRQSFPRKRIYAYRDNWIDRWQGMFDIRPDAIIRRPEVGKGDTLFMHDGRYQSITEICNLSRKK